MKINFSLTGASPIGQLPIDPVNTIGTANISAPSLYYTFACDTSLNYEINANMESANYKPKEADDGGNSAVIYEMGTNATILPTTAAGYYPFN